MFAAAGVGEAFLGGLCDKQVRASGFQDDGLLGEEVVDGGNWSGRRIDQRSRRAGFKAGAEEERRVAGGRGDIDRDLVQLSVVDTEPERAVGFRREEARGDRKSVV